jgi:multidrug resistance efflux pump
MATECSYHDPTRTRPSAPREIVLLRAVVIALAVALGLSLYVLRGLPGEVSTSAVITTDNAYVRGQVTTLAPRVSGYVTEVLVQDFQHVRAGDALVRIDDRIYREQLELATGKLSLAQNTAEVGARRASLVQAEAEHERALADYDRVKELAKRGSVSLRERDQVRAALRTAEADVKKARASIEIGEEMKEATRVSRGVLEAKTAEAQLELARIELDNTVIRAPRAGDLGEVAVRPGQYVTQGAQLVSLVPEQLWVIANFEEAQLHRLEIGQPVTFSVDALAGAKLTGRVERIAPATGAELSEQRADAATGDFTKVAQRIPVRVEIDPEQPLASRLRAGMSVVTEVDTSPKERLASAGVALSSRASLSASR